jgi:glycosyltransferase involved in cell wall biosynthesis
LNEQARDGTLISACIVCRNDADRLGDCLRSVDWVDDIVVLDLESEDASAKVASEHGARVVRRPRVPIVELVRNEAAAHARGDWILVLDPDERVSPGLASELSSLRVRDDLDGIWIPRMNIDFGHTPESPVHRYEFQLRMYRRSRVEWPLEPNRLPLVPEDRVYRVAARDELVLVHDRNRTVAEAIERVLRYAPAEAEAMIARGEVFTARAMLRTLTSKARRQFLQGDALGEGVPGVIRATVLVAFHFYVWAAFWQLSGARRTHEDDAYLRRFRRAVRLATAANRVARLPRRAAGRLVRQVSPRAQDDVPAS